MSRHATDMVPEVPPSPSPPALSSPEDGVQYIAMSLQPLSEGKVELDDKAGEQPMEPNPVTTASGTGQVGLGRLEWGRQAMHAGEGAGVAGMGQDGRGTMANEAGIAQTGSPTTQHRGHEDGLEGTLGHFTHHDVLPGPSAETEDDGTARGPERKNEIDSNTTSPAGRTPPIARTSLNGHSAALAPQSSLAQDMASGQNSTDSASLVPEHAFVQPSNKHVSIVSPTPSMKMDISSPDLSNGDAFAASDKKLLPVDPADDSKQAIAVSSTVITGGPTSSVSANSTTTPSATAGIGAGTTTTWAALSSWKSRSGKTTIEKKRLRALGFEEELTREYDFWASVGLTICNIGGFPGTALGVLTALNAGGASMYSIAWPISGLFMLALAAVLGEMASTWPVAGAMFTWTFRICRTSRRLDPWARFLSWIVGSFLLVSHVLLQILITWQFAHNLLGTIGLYTHERYSAWVTVGICWAILVLCGLVVSSPLSRSPWLWRGAGALIVVFFLTLNITLWTQSEQIRPASYVFGDYRNYTGFTSKSYVYMLGWVLTCCATGMEASAHIAEDTRSPSRTVPQAMFWGVAATYIMGWVSICSLLATVDLTGLDPTLQPSIALIANSIPLKHTTAVLVCVLCSFLFQAVAQLLATSRYTWALARESALPWSHIVRRLSKANKLPLTAIWLIVAMSAPVLLLLTINTSIISTILLEGAGISVVLTYATPPLLYLFCPKDALVGDGRAQWTLRRWSKPIAAVGCVFALTFMVMLCLPTGWPVNALNASYAAGVVLFIFLASAMSWVFYGNSHYAGPIKTTTRWTIGAEVDLPRSKSKVASRKSKKTTGAAAAGAGAGAVAAGAPGGGLSAAGSDFADEYDEESGTGGMGRNRGRGRDRRETTTSAQYGRSAHVFSSFPTLMTHDGPPLTETEEFETDTGTEWTTGSGSGTGTGIGTETGVGLESDVTDTDDDDDDDDDDGASSASSGVEAQEDTVSGAEAPNQRRSGNRSSGRRRRRRDDGDAVVTRDQGPAPVHRHAVMRANGSTTGFGTAPTPTPTPTTTMMGTGTRSGTGTTGTVSGSGSGTGSGSRTGTGSGSGTVRSSRWPSPRGSPQLSHEEREGQRGREHSLNGRRDHHQSPHHQLANVARRTDAA